MSEPIKLPPDLLAVTLAREGVNKHRARDIECWMNEKMALAVEQATAALRAECDALRAACSIVADRLQMDIDDGSRPDQWSMQDMVRTLDAARAALKEAKE